MRSIKLLLLGGVMLFGAHECRAAEGAQVCRGELHQLFVASRSGWDGEEAEAHVKKLLEAVQQLGSKQFAAQLSQEKSEVRQAVLGWLLPILGDQPERRQLYSELQRLARN